MQRATPQSLKYNESIRSIFQRGNGLGVSLGKARIYDFKFFNMYNIYLFIPSVASCAIGVLRVFISLFCVFTCFFLCGYNGKPLGASMDGLKQHLQVVTTLPRVTCIVGRSRTHDSPDILMVPTIPHWLQIDLHWRAAASLLRYECTRTFGDQRSPLGPRTFLASTPESRPPCAAESKTVVSLSHFSRLPGTLTECTSAMTERVAEHLYI